MIPTGDVDLGAVGALLGDRARCRVLLALDDGRALPASRLASEAGVTPATISSHLGKLVAAGLLSVERHGRHRYYRLAGPAVGELVEILTQLAPAPPVRSLREGTRAQAIRDARTCYDHLAGRLGVAVMDSLLDRGHLDRSGRRPDPQQEQTDRLTGYGTEADYHLTTVGRRFLAEQLGVAMSARPVIRYCVDWSEQRHHIGGAAGRALLRRFLDLDWLRPSTVDRAVEVTEQGRAGFAEHFDITLR
jgi:DNA-binding transcriptional ArsR family regulator